MRATAFVPLLSLLFGASAFAQATAPAQTISQAAADEPQTVIGDQSTRPTTISGWFIAPTFATTGFAGQLAYSPGLRGGVYLNRRVAIGAAINGLGSDDSSFGSNEVRNAGSYGGLLLQYVVQSNRLVHATLETTVGSGQWYVRAADVDGQDVSEGRRFLAVEPAANVELNVSKHFRFATGVGYRFAVAGAGTGPSGRDMSSLVVRSCLVFGSF